MKLTDILNEFEMSPENQVHSEVPNYMVTQNIKQMIKQLQVISEMSEDELLSVMAEHPWAVDHLTTSKDDIEEVYNFLTNK
jgi:SUMO ligase MMS21 Smc5/6 complex component